jgi:hypothetical protein
MVITQLFGRYHRLIRELASRRAPEDAWRASLRVILQALDDDCRKLPRRSGDMLRQELSNQLEHELLRSTDSETGRVLSVALKHLEADA